MKTAVLYTTTYGTTAKCAEALAEKIGEGSQAISLKDTPNPDLSGFQALALGGSIYVGKIQSEMEKFIKARSAEILGKPLVLFICAMQDNEMENQLCNAFPEELREHALKTAWVGGAYYLNKMGWLHRTMIKTIAKVSEEQEAIQWEVIDQLANLLKTK